MAQERSRRRPVTPPRRAPGSRSTLPAPLPPVQCPLRPSCRRDALEVYSHNRVTWVAGGLAMAGTKILKLAVLGGVVMSVLACAGHPKPKAGPAAAPVAVATPVPPAAEPAAGEVAAPLAATAAPARPAEAAPGGQQGAASELPAEVPGEVAADDLETEEVVDGLAEAAAAADSEASRLLQESLDGYESSRALWDQGEIDEALGALDAAYLKMAQVPIHGESMLAQEKENLRQLISKRIVEIYASRRSAVGNADLSIPREVNADVEREIASFQGREREFFLAAYQRSGLYRPMILAKLQAAGLPEALSWLPLVESGFKERALSSARAVGLWQFIASTGYRYGLSRTDWVDERMDPIKATEGAIGYLTDLHALLGDWLTALAAYNCGEQNVLRQIQRQKESYFDQFWDLYARLPQETRRYVPRFLATLAILENPAKYGFELPEPLPPMAYETVEVARATKLESLDRALELEPGTLLRLNPELRRNATPRTPYPLRVPPGTGTTLLASVETLPEWTPPKVEVTTHRVRSGETLSSIAARYRTSVNTLLALNHLRSAHRLSVGQRLQVPGGRGGGELATAPSSTPAQREARAAPTALAPGATMSYVVRSGDNLWQIATRYGTTVDQIKRDNALRGNALQVGQTLLLRAAAAAGGGV